MRDLVPAFRSLSRSPGFSLTAVCALALGIGAATAVFSVTDHLLFRKLPYADPARLVSIGADVRSKGQSNWAVYPDEYDGWKTSIRTLSDMGGFQTFGRFTVSRPDAPIEIPVSRVTPNLLSVLGVVPVLGRPFAESDYLPGAPVALLLTDRTWRREFGADDTIAGRFLVVNGAPGEIAGVLPATFAFPFDTPDQPQALIPLARTKDTALSRIHMIGRLAPGVTLEAARSEINAIAAARAGESGMRNARIDGATVQPLDEALGQKSQPVLRLLIGAVFVLLLIGCANVANLLLARGTDRAGELAVRLALGASRASLIRLLLTETAMLAVAGGIAGAALAYVTTLTIGPLIPADLQRLGEAAVDARALLFAAAASGAVLLIAGLGPAVTAVRVNLSPSLAHVSNRTTGVRWRARQMLVALEVALAAVLLVAGGLMVNSIVRVLGVDSGYTPSSALTMRVQLPRGQEAPKRSREFVQRVIGAARGVPGVLDAGASETVPLGNALAAAHYLVEGFSYEWIAQGASKSGPCCLQTQWISARYLSAAGIQIVRGRGFSEDDAAGAPKVALIGERLAQRFPAGLDPIGHYLTSVDDPKDQSDRRLIVGIVHDVRDMTLEREALPTIYLPMEERGTSAMTVVLRTSVDPASIGGAVQKAVREGTGPVVITDVRTFGDLMKRSVAPRHLNAWLFGSFAVLGLLLAAVGIASIVFYSVARRTREIGVRLALGARPADIRRLVVLESMTPVVLGLVLGLGAALLLSRLAESFLFGIAARDPFTYVVISALLLVIAVIAALLPARRASRVDPLVALRSE